MNRIPWLIESVVDRREILGTARAQRLLREWERFVGPILAQRSWPERYVRGTVWIAVEGPAWAQELRMAKNRILKALRDASGELALFDDLRFGVRKASPRLRPIPKPRTRIPADAGRDELSIAEIAERMKQRNHAP